MSGLSEGAAGPARRPLWTRPAVVVGLLIALGIVARLYRIDGPPFGYHWIRQYDTAALVRNFYEGAMNPWYPQVDWRGDSPGYVESELPAYTYLVALLYRLVGVQEWVGRAVNVGLYALSAALLFRLAARLLGEPAAVLAVFFYTVVPLSVFFTRTLQGDALMCLGSLTAVFFFLRWTDQSRLSDLVLSGLGASLAIAIKPFTAYLALPLGYLAYRRFGWRGLGKGALWLYALGVCAPPVVWYRHAFHLWEQYGNTLFRGYARLDMPAVTDPFWRDYAKVVLERVVWVLATPAGLALLVVGFLARPRDGNRVLHWWVAGLAVSMILMNEAHYDHDYYQLPLVFAVSIWMAQGATLLVERGLLSRVAVGLLCLGTVIASQARLREMFQIDPWEYDAISFGRRVAELTEPDALMVFVQSGSDPRRGEWFQYRLGPGEYLLYNPLDFYLSGRKGWSLSDRQVSPDLIERLRQRGARYLATWSPHSLEADPRTRPWLEATQEAVEVTPRWVVYRLVPPATPSP